MFAVSWTHCYSPIENQVVPMTYLVAKPYSPRGSGRGECINNGRQALPSLVRPRFLPGDQKGFGALQLSYSYLLFHGDAASSRVLSKNAIRRIGSAKVHNRGFPHERRNGIHAPDAAVPRHQATGSWSSPDVPPRRFLRTLLRRRRPCSARTRNHAHRAQ